MGKELLIGHITDLHYPVYTAVRFKDIITKRVTGAANLFFSSRRRFRPHLLENSLNNLNRLRVDHLIISGDIVNLAYPEEFQAVCNVLKNSNFGPESVTIVPGNHDVYLEKAESERFFWQYLHPYVDAQGPDDYPTIHDKKDFIIIGISSARPTGWGFAYGEIGEKQLDEFENILNANKDRKKVVVLHHPPYVGPDSFSDGLIDGVKFREIIWRQGVDLILHGHEHYDMVSYLQGKSGTRVPVLGTGCAILDDKRSPSNARARLIRMTNGVMEKTWVVTYNKKTNHWKPVEENG